MRWKQSGTWFDSSSRLYWFMMNPTPHSKSLEPPLYERWCNMIYKQEAICHNCCVISGLEDIPFSTWHIKPGSVIRFVARILGPAHVDCRWSLPSWSWWPYVIEWKIYLDFMLDFTTQNIKRVVCLWSMWLGKLCVYIAEMSEHSR